MKLKSKSQLSFLSVLFLMGIIAIPQTSYSQINRLSEPVMELPTPKQEGGMPLMDALRLRSTRRDFVDKKISDEVLSDLLWAAYGVNRPETGKRTAPSARNCQEIDLYVFSFKGIFLYNAVKNSLELVEQGDFRKEISDQPHFSKAPISIVLVADYGKMKNYDQDAAEFYSAVDAGYISQNIYLFCASAKMSTVACGGIKRDVLQKLLQVEKGKVLLAHPIGFGE